MTIAIAMSGGIDSLVSAWLLKDQGVSVFGVHFKTGFEPRLAPDVPDPMDRLSAQLEIPIHTLDLSEVFRTRVVDYFIQTYRSGLTPNPCLFCNPHIKFGALLGAAERLGADTLATGHYARVSREETGRCRLSQGKDSTKDQSYFLAFLSQEQLAKACFPLGAMTKAEVRGLAREKGLIPSQTAESQDVCFIREKSYVDFLKEAGVPPLSGDIITLEGTVIGRHQGLYQYTIGQRKGIDCPSTAPYYVVRLDADRNALVVGRKQDLDTPYCRVARVNWIAPPPDGPIPVFAKLRYRQEMVAARLEPWGADGVTLYFDTPQQAPTPGQGAVFYHESQVLGGGIITS